MHFAGIFAKRSLYDQENSQKRPKYCLFSKILFLSNIGGKWGAVTPNVGKNKVLLFLINRDMQCSSGTIAVPSKFHNRSLNTGWSSCLVLVPHVLNLKDLFDMEMKQNFVPNY